MTLPRPSLVACALFLVLGTAAAQQPPADPAPKK
jgi:hypothetical protein